VPLLEDSDPVAPTAKTINFGANGVGKSNVLDAIVFLSALADRPLIDAALSVRDQKARTVT